MTYFQGRAISLREDSVYKFMDPEEFNAGLWIEYPLLIFVGSFISVLNLFLSDFRKILNIFEKKHIKQKNYTPPLKRNITYPRLRTKQYVEHQTCLIPAPRDPGSPCQ